jgi:hypothetical protein
MLSSQGTLKWSEKHHIFHYNKHFLHSRERKSTRCWLIESLGTSLTLGKRELLPLSQEKILLGKHFAPPPVHRPGKGVRESSLRALCAFQSMGDEFSKLGGCCTLLLYTALP